MSFLLSACCGISQIQFIASKKSGRFSPVGVSAAGGAAHNLGQIAVAALVMESGGVYWFFPVLCLSGVAAGVIIGIIAGMLVKRIKIAQI